MAEYIQSKHWRIFYFWSRLRIPPIISVAILSFILMECSSSRHNLNRTMTQRSGDCSSAIDEGVNDLKIGDFPREFNINSTDPEIKELLMGSKKQTFRTPSSKISENQAAGALVYLTTDNQWKAYFWKTSTGGLIRNESGFVDSLLNITESFMNALMNISKSHKLVSPRPEDISLMVGTKKGVNVLCYFRNAKTGENSAQVGGMLFSQEGPSAILCDVLLQNKDGRLIDASLSVSLTSAPTSNNVQIEILPK